MSTPHVPRIYRQPWGGPLRWQDDVTGVLPQAVCAFLDEQGQGGKPAKAEQVELVRDYCEYYINAPCWATEGAEHRFADLRERIKTLKTVQEVAAWIVDCLQVGIDPL